MQAKKCFTACIAFCMSFLVLLPFFTSARTLQWEELDSEITEDINVIAGIEDDLIWIAGQGGAIAYVSDLSEPWINVTEGAVDYHGISFAEGGTIIVGEESTVIWTDDFGEHWRDYSPGTATSYYDVEFEQRVQMSGWIVGTGGVIEFSDTYGEFWQEQDSGVDTTLRALDFYDEEVGWVVGAEGVILYTDSTGETWELQDSGTSNYLYTVDAVESESGLVWVGGENATLLRTDNDGLSWESIGVTDLISEEDIISGISFVDEDNGIVTTHLGDVLITEDGGQVWGLIEVDREEIFSHVHYPNINSAFVAGLDGEVYSMSDVNDNPLVPENFALSNDREATSDLTPGFVWDAAQDADEDVSYYEFRVDEGEYQDIGNVLEYEIESDLGVGSHQAFVRAIDEAENIGTAAELEFVIDGEDPIVSTVVPRSVAVNTSTEFKAFVADDGGIASCTLHMDGQALAMVDNGSYFSADYKFSTLGSAQAYVTCEDHAGNSVNGVTADIEIRSEASDDVTSPIVGPAASASVGQGSTLTITLTATDQSGIAQCRMYQDGVFLQEMDVDGSSVSMVHTFDIVGSFTMQAQCTDLYGNSGTGNAFTLTVLSGVASQDDIVLEELTIAPETGQEIVMSLDDVDVGSLVTTTCAGKDSVTDPCRAVYYYSDSGERHAFPNEKVFFTWYDDFEDVIYISESVLAQMQLGSNVTYRPGIRMVKFQSVNTVYAVGQGGELHAIASEEVAQALYGEDWNSLIDDISDVFYLNYTFGSEILDTSEFDIEGTTASAIMINDILN